MSDVSALAKPSKSTRSRVTNGSALFASGVDGRTQEARRFRDILGEIVSDMGGASGLSEGQKQLARRAAMLSVQCEGLEAKAVAGEAIDPEVFGKLTDRLGRAFARIGLKRVARDVTPDLQTFLRYREAAR